MSALSMLWNGTTCCVASRKASHKARLNVSFRPYLVKCCRITEIFILIIVQRVATQSRLYSAIILQFHSTCFGCQPHPPSGVHKTVTTASGTGHIFVQLPPSNVTKPRWREVAAQVPETVVTVLCTPDDGCGWHPKHVEWTCRIIYRLLCVASCWTIINIDQRCTKP